MNYLYYTTASDTVIICDDHGATISNVVDTTLIASFDDNDDEAGIINMFDSSNNIRGRPVDTVEVLRKKSRERCKEISALQNQIAVLQKELSVIKEKSITQCLYDLVERAGNSA